MIPYVHLANKLAEKGHLVTFLLPKKAKIQLEPLSLFPDSIVFDPLTFLMLMVSLLAQRQPRISQTLPGITCPMPWHSCAVHRSKGINQPPGYPSSKMVLRGYDATLCSDSPFPAQGFFVGSPIV
ncbi:unnamed protein product [Microthlaspi erraticum]|uniref:Uncharacterized protein n=1 Tax=Microthlaspi erraticum TaxID=1685480 RepID=A0A6D2L8M9_9BRAS|nr:unnamed protein product [Microthlaspi erraticum]